MDTQKKLLAYQISGETVGVDLSTWEVLSLNGNEPFQVICSATTTPNGYVDISSIGNWDSFGFDIANDYAVGKFEIKDIVNILGWSGMTNIEKDLSIKYFSYPDSTTAVIYLMTTKSWSQEQAGGFVLLSWHHHHLKIINAFTQRWNYAKFTVLQYLSRLDGEDLFNTVKPLISLYSDLAIIGRDYGDNNDGIIDYINSTHGFSGQGLEENNYTLIHGTWAEFKKAMYAVLVCGIYNKYDDI